MRRNENRRMTLGVGHHTTLTVNILFKTLIFPIIGKRNNQSPVSDADREIPTLGSKDNAGNSVNLVSGIIRSTSGWDWSALETNDRFYLSHFNLFFYATFLEQIKRIRSDISRLPDK